MKERDRTNSPKGEHHGSSKLKENEVVSIRSLYKTGKYSTDDIAKKFNISKQNVFAIISGTSWGHIIPEGEPISLYPLVKQIRKENGIILNHIDKKLSPDQVREIRRLNKETNLFQKDIGEKFGVSAGVVYSIIKGRTYKDVI